MTYVAKTVGTSHLGGPRLNLVAVDLYGAPAIAANEVMVVVGGAGTKQGLAVGGGDAVGIVVGGQVGERTINGS